MTAIPPTIALGMSLYLDESPTWLAEKGKHERAKTVLSKICRENCGRDLPLGVRIVPASEVEEGGNTGVHTSVSSDGGDVLVDSNDQKGGGMEDGKFRDSTEKKKKNSFGKDALFATNPNLGRRLVEPAGHENELGANFVFMDPRVRADV